MKAAVLQEYGRIVWQDVPVPAINDDQVLIRVNYASICGTDQHIFKGEFHPRTRLPLIPGHEFAGTITELGKNVRDYKLGDSVAVDPVIWCGECAACQIQHYPACVSLKLLGVDIDGGFGEYIAVNMDKLYLLEPEINSRDAALIELFSIGFHACRRAELKSNDTVAIWGTGKVGHSILQAVRTKTQNTVFLIDIIDQRLTIAKRYYDNVHTINVKNEDPILLIKEMTQGRGVDVAFEAVGHAVEIEGQSDPVQSCIKTIRGAGTVCVLGLSNQPTSILMKELIWREARIIASRVNQGEYSEAIQHLAQGNLKPEVLITKEMSAREAQKAFEILARKPENYLKILLKLE